MSEIVTGSEDACASSLPSQPSLLLRRNSFSDSQEGPSHSRSCSSMSSSTACTPTSISPPPADIMLVPSEALPSTSRGHRHEQKFIQHSAPATQADQQQAACPVLKQLEQQTKPRSSSGSFGSGNNSSSKRRIPTTTSSTSSSSTSKKKPRVLNDSGKLKRSSASAASSPRASSPDASSGTSSSTSSSENEDETISAEGSFLRSFGIRSVHNSGTRSRSGSTDSSLSSFSSSSSSYSSSSGDEEKKKRTKKRKSKTKGKSSNKSSNSSVSSKKRRSSDGSERSKGKKKTKKRKSNDSNNDDKKLVSSDSIEEDSNTANASTDTTDNTATSATTTIPANKNDIHVILPDLDTVLPEQHNVTESHHRRLTSFSWETIISKQQMQQFFSGKQRQQQQQQGGGGGGGLVNSSSFSSFSSGLFASNSSGNLLGIGNRLSYEQLLVSRSLVWVPMGRGSIFSVQNHSLTATQLFSRRSIPVLVIRSKRLRSLRGRPVCLYCHGSNDELLSCHSRLSAFAEEHSIDVVALEFRGYGIRSNCAASFSTVFQDMAIVLSHILECWDGPLVLYGSQLGAVAILHFAFTLFSPSRLKIDHRTVIFRGLLAGIICDNLQVITEHVRREAELFASTVECPVVLSTPSPDSAVVTSIRMLSMLFHNATFYWGSTTKSSSKTRKSTDGQEEASFSDTLNSYIFSNVDKMARPLDQFLYLQASSSRVPKLAHCTPEGLIVCTGSTTSSSPPPSSSSSTPQEDASHKKKKKGSPTKGADQLKHRHRRSHSHGSDSGSVSAAIRLPRMSDDDSANTLKTRNLRLSMTKGLMELRDDSVKEEDKPYQELRNWLQKRGMDGWYGDLFVSLKLCSIEAIAKIPLDSNINQCYMFLRRLIEDARDSVDLSEMSWSEAKAILNSSAVPLIIRPESRKVNRVRIPDSVARGWLEGIGKKQTSTSAAATSQTTQTGSTPPPPHISLSITPPDYSQVEREKEEKEEFEPSKLSVPSNTRKRSNSTYEKPSRFSSSSLRVGSPSFQNNNNPIGSPVGSRRPRRNSVFAGDNTDQNFESQKDTSRGSSTKNTLRRVKQLLLGKGSSNTDE